MKSTVNMLLTGLVLAMLYCDARPGSDLNCLHNI